MFVLLGTHARDVTSSTRTTPGRLGEAGGYCSCRPPRPPATVWHSIPCLCSHAIQPRCPPSRGLRPSLHTYAHTNIRSPSPLRSKKSKKKKKKDKKKKRERAQAALGEEEKEAVVAVGGGKHARQADSSEDEYEQEDGGLADTRTPNQKHFDDMKRKRLKKDIGHWTAKTHREKINVRFGRTGGAGENRRMRGAAWRARRWWCVWCVCGVSCVDVVGGTWCPSPRHQSNLHLRCTRTSADAPY